MKIYTKSGDKGRTSLASGKRVSKSDLRLEAYGTADELNSFVGWLRALLDKQKGDWREGVDAQLAWVQNRLFDLGAILAGAQMPMAEGSVNQLEEWIDQMQEQLPELRAFILPGGGQMVAACHVCRTVTRRLERAMVVLEETKIEGGESVGEEVMIFLNRLSDYCFVLARFVALKEEIELPIWKK